jgi:hypothetical protein
VVQVATDPQRAPIPDKLEALLAIAGKITSFTRPTAADCAQEITAVEVKTGGPAVRPGSLRPSEWGQRAFRIRRQPRRPTHSEDAPASTGIET